MYRELLEEEMKKSEAFSKENFGQAVAPDFPEFVKDITTSESLAATLLIELVMVGMIGGREVADSMRGHENDKNFKMGDVLIKNARTFQTPMSMLYWGIQIGRRLERESKEVNELEKLFGKKENQ